MKRFKSDLLAFSIAAALSVSAALADEPRNIPILSAVSPQGEVGVEATAQGRLVLGVPDDYLPLNLKKAGLTERELFSRLRDNMKYRREFGWEIVKDVMKPTQVVVPGGVNDVPKWLTWYEMTPPHEAPALVQDYFEILRENPGMPKGEAAESAMRQHADVRGLAARDEDFTRILNQFRDLDGEILPHGLTAAGRTLFSKSFIKHILVHSDEIMACDPGSQAPDTELPGDSFSHCIPEFPRSAVMVKTSWENLNGAVPVHDTSAKGMAAVMKNGTWLGAQPNNDPKRGKMFIVNADDGSANGLDFGLTGIHFVTKDVREWVWVSLWWDPDPRADFGADAPVGELREFNHGVWTNYKMCVQSAFVEGDTQPGSHYAATHASLDKSLDATLNAVLDQIQNGGQPALRRNGTSIDPGNDMGPWDFPPASTATTWCSNPNIEVHPGNGRTSCVGCHQLSAANHPAPGGRRGIGPVLLGDLPQFGRTKVRQNFPADFAWSYGDWRELLKSCKELVDANENGSVCAFGGS